MNERIYKMIAPRKDSEEQMVTVFNGAQKLVAKFHMNPQVRKCFRGNPSVLVKADIIDGVFTLQKILK